jgi:hypothetical protein
LHRLTRILFVGLYCANPLFAQVTPQHKTQHIIFVMTDGFRWQEVFRGADASLMNKKNGKANDPKQLKAAYWRDTIEARRAALLPFVWSTIATQGQIFGNHDKGSDAQVSNGLFFSSLPRHLRRQPGRIRDEVECLRQCTHVLDLSEWQPQ